MGVREEFQKRIDKKQQEIRDLETKLREANIYLQALLDSLRWLPRDEDSVAVTQSLRPGTILAKAQEAIKKSWPSDACGRSFKSHWKTSRQKESRFS